MNRRPATQSLSEELWQYTYASEEGRKDKEDSRRDNTDNHATTRQHFLK